MRTLVFVRSLGIIGQVVAVVIVFFGLKYQLNMVHANPSRTSLDRGQGATTDGGYLRKK